MFKVTCTYILYMLSMSVSPKSAVAKKQITDHPMCSILYMHF